MTRTLEFRKKVSLQCFGAFDRPGVTTMLISFRLVNGGKRTNSYWKLCDGRAREGAMVTQRRGGYCDRDLIRTLCDLGLLEERPSGPRGGTRYHTTRAGRRQIKRADQFVSNETGV